MINNGRKSVVFSFRSDRRLEDIIRISNLSLCDLVEAGLISMAKSPGSKNDKLLQEAIRLEEDRIAYHSGLLKELVKMKDLKQEETTAKAQAKPEKTPCRILVRSLKTKTLYWITDEMAQGNREIFKQVSTDEDEGEEYDRIYSPEDIPECEMAGAT